MLSNAVQFEQFRQRCIKGAVKRAETVEQHMSQFVGVLPCDRIEQKKFQYLMILKILEAFLQEALFHAGAVACVGC